MNDLQRLGIEVVEIGRIEQLHSLRVLFGHMGPSTSALAALAQLSTPVRIPKGTVLATEDEPAARTFLILDGSIEVSRAGKQLGLFGVRGSVGVLNVLAREPRGSRLVALADTTALMLRAEDMLEILEDHFELMLNVMRGLSSGSIVQRKQLKPHAGFSNQVRESIEHCDHSDHAGHTGHDAQHASIDLVERIRGLRASFGLEHSRIDELAELARLTDEVRHPVGTQLWSIGDGADRLLIILSGSIRGSTPEGHDFTLGPGDFAGLLDSVGVVPRWYDARVTEPLVALTLQSEHLVDACEDQPELGFDFLRMLANTMISLRTALAVTPSQASATGKLP